MAEAPEEKPLNLLLLGKTGNGKSMTGNTILQKDVFIEQAGGNSVTQDCELSGNKVFGRQIYVLDTPGSMDTEDPNNAMKILATAIFKLQNCVDAFVIVMNYNLRMTNEERMCLNKLEELFGPQIFDFVVFVFTHADVYEKYKKRRKETMSLEDFVRENGGKFFQEVLSKCHNRCIGVDNTAEEDEIEIESSKILTAIDDMISQNNGKRYQCSYLKNENISRVASLRASLPMNQTLEEVAKQKYAEIEHFDTHGPEYFDDLDEIEIETREIEIQEREPIANPSPQQFINNEVPHGIQQKRIDKVTKEMQDSGAECFPADALVKVPGKGDVKLKDLSVGDKVMTLDNNMKLRETEVYIFGHALEKCKATFINIQTKGCKLQATKGHLVFVLTEEVQTTKAVRDVKVGDKLVTSDLEGESVIKEVRKIWESEEEGLFAPFTLSGSLVVDGVLVSCYVDVLPDSVAHLLLWPVRMMYRCSPSTLAAVSTKGQDGIPGWMRWCLDQLI